MEKLNHATRLAVVATAASLLIGCQGGMQPDYAALNLAEVTGRVTYDGNPLADGYIIFENENGTFSYGNTDSSGSYRLMYNSEKSGIAPGMKTVRITGQSFSDEEEEFSDAPERIPAKYNTQSELRVEVVPGSQTHNFDLTR